MAAHRRGFRRGTTFLGGLGIGAGLMYILDPDRGARRRSMIRDQASHALHAERAVVDKGVRDLDHRAAGLVARLRAALSPEQVSDEQIALRVRAKMGRCVSHPGSIEVWAHDGTVAVSGPILSNEVDSLLACVRLVRGVSAVESHLEPHESADGVPGLQGAPRRRPRPLLLRENWPPAVRLVSAGTGLVGSAYGLRRGGLAGSLLAGAGAALLVRAVTNLPAKRLVGVSTGRRAIDLHKTMAIAAPIDEVFDFWTHFERFPSFMEHVRGIQVSEDGKRSHWKVVGPGGTTISWDAEVTSMVPNEVIAWKTLPNATVEHAGIIRFEKVDEDHTRLDIRMSYNPPAGAIGHTVAKLFHKDAKSAMDDDMVRLQGILEGRGKPRSTRQRAEAGEGQHQRQEQEDDRTKMEMR